MDPTRVYRFDHTHQNIRLKPWSMRRTLVGTVPWVSARRTEYSVEIVGERYIVPAP